MGRSAGLLCLVLCLPMAGAVPQRRPSLKAAAEEYINTLGGTQNLGGQELSFGNQNPDVTLPWGFNSWSPTNSAGGGNGWFFNSGASHLYGIRCSHQPSPWIGDYGQFRLNSAIVDPAHGAVDESSPYKVRDSTWSPYHFHANQLKYGSRDSYSSIEVTPTNHGAIMRFKFPALATNNLASGWNQTRRILVSLDKPDADQLSLGPPGPGGLLSVSGAATINNGGIQAKSFAHYFFFTVGGGADGTTVVSPFSSAVRTDGGYRWAFLDFSPADAATDTLVLRIATSFISAEQAMANHAQEVVGQSFEAVYAAAKAAWAVEMSRAQVLDVGAGYSLQEQSDLLTTFYSSLYRASKFPRNLAETVNGQTVHWSPYTGNIEPGALSTDQGFWDGYRTSYSLYALTRPDRFAIAMDGWLNAYREGGWVPQWSSPGYRGGMTGTLSDVVFAEAIVKLPHCGTARALSAGYCVNASAAYAASRENAYVIPSAGNPEGRSCLADYIRYGYVPLDSACDASVSRSMNYWLSDYSLAQAAALLGFVADAAELSARAANWTKLFDPQTAFMLPKKMDGTFTQEFDEFAWGPSPGYTEAGAWQYRTETPYDPQGLFRAFAAVNINACDVIEQANTMTSASHPGGYGDTIHEAAEMAITSWGQWEIGNQPNWAMQHMAIAFDTNVTGPCAGRAQYWLRKTNSLFRPGADMFPGDEDNGSMGAWLVLNALGIYPLSPASGNYVIGSPLFAKVLIPLDGGSNITISALNQSPDNVYVQGVSWNGVPIAGVYVAYSDLVKGGILEFTMGPVAAAARR